MINASKATLERLNAIQGLRGILFSGDWKKKLLERTQLHRILAKETWIFGEEYFTSGDDEALKAVLQKHVKIMWRENIIVERTPDEIEALEQIPDLMLSRRICRTSSDYIHLVVELKRPSVELSESEVIQIEKYAQTVWNDEAFSKNSTQWRFVLIGNTVSDYVETRRMQNHLQHGCISMKDGFSVWVNLWSEVFDNAEARYKYFRDKLEYEISQETAISKLHNRYPELLSGRGLTKKKEIEHSEIKNSGSFNKKSNRKKRDSSNKNNKLIRK